jgi:hypothetical protein
MAPKKGHFVNQRVLSLFGAVPLGSELQFADEQNGFAFYTYTIMDYYRDFDLRVVEAAQNSFLFYTHDGGRS